MVIQLKAHVRLGHWDNAAEVLARIERQGARSRHYLRGFIHWKRGDWALAVEAFRAAIDAGDRSMSVRRDLATCLFKLGKLSEARQELEQIDERAAASNRFVLDLMAHITISLGNFDAGQALVDQLRRHAFRAEYLNRLAHLRLAQERADEALSACDEALKVAPYRRESLWLKAEALALLGRVAEAERLISGLPTVTMLDEDVKRAMLEILRLKRTSDWRFAANALARIQSGNSETVMRLRLLTLQQAVRDPALSAVERAQFEHDLSRLRSEQGDFESIPPEFAVLPET